VSSAPGRRYGPARTAESEISRTQQKENGAMQIDKQQIVDMLKNRGDNDKATQAQSELPDQVDTDKDSGLLDKFGINPQDLLGKLPGGLG
jgi:hypothetical protein